MTILVNILNIKKYFYIFCFILLYFNVKIIV